MSGWYVFAVVVVVVVVSLGCVRRLKCEDRWLTLDLCLVPAHQAKLARNGH